MERIVVKFGGSTLSTAERILRAAAFVREDSRRTIVVVSAPGKRPGKPDDEKVTDMLIACAQAKRDGGRWESLLDDVSLRFSEIVRQLPVHPNITKARFAEIRERIASASPTEPHLRDYIISRGEYLMGLIMAELLAMPFRDPAEFVTFNTVHGAVELNDTLTYDRIHERFGADPRGVVPGFYGAMLSHLDRIKTFARGGSDVTGAILARGISALRYENCTDVPGILAADPRIVRDPAIVESMTYWEASELAYTGACVLHPDVLYPLAGTGIPTRVLNALEPEGRFTKITDELADRTMAIVGVSGRRGFQTLNVEQAKLHTRRGFLHEITGIIAENGVSLEHVPSGLDSLSFLIHEDQLTEDRANRIECAVCAHFKEARVTWLPGATSIIAVVGEGMRHHTGIAARIFASVAQADVNITFISQGASERTIVFGVDENDHDKTIRTVYARCVDPASRRYVSPNNT